MNPIAANIKQTNTGTYTPAGKTFDEISKSLVASLNKSNMINKIHSAYDFKYTVAKGNLQAKLNEIGIKVNDDFNSKDPTIQIGYVGANNTPSEVALSNFLKEIYDTNSNGIFDSNENPK